MVWAALIYALSGSLVSWHIGRPLVSLGSERYSREADFRFALVQGSERAEGIALSNGEADSLRGLNASLASLIGVLRKLAFKRVRLTWVTAGYGWVALVFPIIVAAPGYFAGKLSFGELMMVVGAFNQVQSSLRWFVDNTGSIADWRATLLRVMNFRQALLSVDTVEAGAGLIDRKEDSADEGFARCGQGRDASRLHRDATCQARGRTRRARAHSWEARIGADELFPRARRALERRERTDQRAGRRAGRLPDPAALPAFWAAAHDAELQWRRHMRTSRCRPRSSGSGSTTSPAASATPRVGIATSASANRNGSDMRDCFSRGRDG